MAKTSQIYRDRKRDRLIAKYAERRAEQRSILQDAGTNLDEKRLARSKLEKMPRNSSPARHSNRCRLTGRSRGVYRKFGLSRIMLRELALKGQIPGMTKSSW